jgi:hypothetical protein
MEAFIKTGAVLLVVVCAGCTRESELGPNGVPADLVPAGYAARECHFEDMAPEHPSSKDETRWQRLVCHHG